MSKSHFQCIGEVLFPGLFHCRRGIALPKQAEEEKQKNRTFSRNKNDLWVKQLTDQCFIASNSVGCEIDG